MSNKKAPKNLISESNLKSFAQFDQETFDLLAKQKIFDEFDRVYNLGYLPHCPKEEGLLFYIILIKQTG